MVQTDGQSGRSHGNVNASRSEEWNEKDVRAWTPCAHILASPGTLPQNTPHEMHQGTEVRNHGLDFIVSIKKGLFHFLCL